MRFRILPLLFLVHFWTIGLGQTEKGSWLVDGKMEFSTIFNFKSYVFDIQPQLGYFFMDNITAGAKAGFFHRKFTGNSVLKYTRYAATPFLRHYFLGGKFRPYVQADFTFDWNRRPFSESSKFKTAASISAGANLFLNTNIAFNVQFIFPLHDHREDIIPRQDKEFKGFRFGLTYFFNQQNNFQTDTLAPLVNRYLKRGNFSIGLNAYARFRNIKQGVGEGTITWSIFLLDKLRLNNKFISVAFWGDDTYDYFTYWGYQPDVQLFIPIAPSAFLTTTFGGDVGLFHTKVPWTSRTEAFGWSLLGKSSLVHFRRNSILEFGAEFRYFFRDRFMVESARWDGDLFLKFTQFLTEQWNVELEVRTNMFGLPKREVFGDQNIDAPEFLRFGFNYFMEKRKAR